MPVGDEVGIPREAPTAGRRPERQAKTQEWPLEQAVVGVAQEGGDLPRAAATPEDSKPDAIQLAVLADGSYNWNSAPISDAELESKLQAEAAKTPQPELHIRGDKNVRYEKVAQAMAAAQRAGVHKIGFITESPSAP